MIAVLKSEVSAYSETKSVFYILIIATIGSIVFESVNIQRKSQIF